jgi:hypothetical protein
MAARISTLIDSQDNVEVIRNQIASILALEESNQKTLALANNKNPNNWKFSVYTERNRLWEILSNVDGSENSEAPLVNISYDTSLYDNKNSDLIYRRRVKSVYYIDCYAHKNRMPNMTGDEATSKEAERIARLVRNIIMSAHYYQLALGYRELGTGNNIVFQRNIIKQEKLLPTDREGQVFENVTLARLTLEVDHDETSPQVELRDLDLLFFQCTKADDGRVYFEIESDLTE